jgi:predicted dehydrogenase
MHGPLQGFLKFSFGLIMTPLKIGFIGGGLNSAVGYTHYTSSHLDGLFRLVAGCFSRDPEINVATAGRYSVDPSRTYATWKQLVETEKDRLDAVVVLTPTPSHAEIVAALLEAKLPVICEKALAISVAECTAIAHNVEEHKGFLAVTYNYSGYPMFRELVARCRAGELGRLHQIQVEMPQEGFLRRQAGTQAPRPQAWRCVDYEIPTVSLDLGVHLHHLVDVVCGGLKPIRVAAAQSHTGLVAGVVDNVNALSLYQEDLLVNAWYGKTALGVRNGLRLRVYGSEGSGEWLQCEPERLTLAHADGSNIVLDPGSPGLLEANQPRYQRFKPGHPGGFIEAFANLYADIAAALQLRKGIGKGPSGPVLGPSHALEGLQWLQALHQAADACSWITTGDTP